MNFFVAGDGNAAKDFSKITGAGVAVRPDTFQRLILAW